MRRTLTRRSRTPAGTFEPSGDEPCSEPRRVARAIRDALRRATRDRLAGPRSIGQLADEIGISPGTLAPMLHGHRTLTAKVAERALRALAQGGEIEHGEYL